MTPPHSKMGFHPRVVYENPFWPMSLQGLIKFLRNLRQNIKLTNRGGRYITGISVYCDPVKKTIRIVIRFCNTGISAISGNHRLFPLTA